MPKSRRYRYNAAECLRASKQARDDFHRSVHLSMALSWLSLARQDEEAPAGARSSRKTGPPCVIPTKPLGQ
jgi:hypothetical protein